MEYTLYKITYCYTPTHIPARD